MSAATRLEKALHVTGEADLVRRAPDTTRVYFGHEFCERLLASASSVAKIARAASREGLGFTLLTPYVTEPGLARLRPVLETLARTQPESEVVFNDWGTLRVLRFSFPSLVPVLGRLLVKMKRGPRLATLATQFNASTADYFRTCSLDVPLYREFLRERGVRRVELDNVLQGIDLDLHGTGLSASLYVPWGYIATTRLCLAASCDRHGMEDEVGIFPCRKECRRFTFELEQLGTTVSQIRKGNTVFFRNDAVPDDATVRGIDRIVSEPALPF